MGGEEDFADFKTRLKALGYTDIEYVNGPDPDRHLALLSKFPIVARNSMENVPYDLNGIPQKVKRGFLDVTIRIAPGYELRCVGVHLKSKLATAEGEALMRRHEAHLLHEHIARILKETPKTHLLVYGDFNDTKNEPAIQEILGPRGSQEGLKDLWLHDEQGDRWTYYWKQADTYSRIDYLMANRALYGGIVQEKSRIFRSSDWYTASDHRPILTTINPEKRP
jgi:endonuclease/exonuclease/phosphatase family metal-dependent hydrolase